MTPFRSNCDFVDCGENDPQASWLHRELSTEQPDCAISKYSGSAPCP